MYHGLSKVQVRQSDHRNNWIKVITAEVSHRPDRCPQDAQLARSRSLIATISPHGWPSVQICLDDGRDAGTLKAYSVDRAALLACKEYFHHYMEKADRALYVMSVHLFDWAPEEPPEWQLWSPGKCWQITFHQPHALEASTSGQEYSMSSYPRLAAAAEL